MNQAVRFGAAVAITVLAGCAVAIARAPRLRFPAESTAFEFELYGQQGLQLAVRSTPQEPSQLTVLIDSQEASFLHRAGSTTIYRLSLPAIEHRPAHVRIETDPPAAVALVPVNAGFRPRHQRLTWSPARPPLQLPEPRPATQDRPVAEASVDETDTYGLRLFGVPVRSAPSVTASLVATVFHGDRLEATCWRTGDRITNGFPERPLGAYTSDIWFAVKTPAGIGYIPDTRFSRRGLADRLALPACGAG